MERDQELNREEKRQTKRETERETKSSKHRHRERERDLLHIGLSSRQMMNLAADWLVKEGGELLRPANGPSCG